MSKRQWLCILGVWVIFFLFLGVPSLWHKIFAVLTGFIIISISYNLPHEQRSDRSNTDHSAYTENNNHTHNT